MILFTDMPMLWLSQTELDAVVSTYNVVDNMSILWFANDVIVWVNVVAGAMIVLFWRRCASAYRRYVLVALTVMALTVTANTTPNADF